MEQDSILDELWGEGGTQAGEVDFGGAYGVGTWPNATLMDVEELDPTDFGYQIKAIFNLKGDEGMKYTTRLGLPRTVEENGDPETYERSCKASDRARNRLAGLMLAADLLAPGRLIANVDNEAAYAKIMGVMRHGIGRVMPLKVRVQQKFNDQTGKWEDTDFTFVEPLRARGKK